MIDKVLTLIFGSKHERDVKAMRPIVAQINALEPEVSALSDDGLRAKTEEFRARLRPAVQALEEVKKEIPRDEANIRIAKADLVSKFQATMNDVIEAMKMSNGLDLGLASMRSPFFFLLTMNLVEAFQVILAHNRRHFWLAREVMARADYPSQ